VPTESWPGQGPAASAPFRFEPSAGPLRCAAYGRGFKLLACLCSLGLLAWGLRLDLDWSRGSWMLAALALMAVTLWHILRGHTELDARSLRQSWIWRKETPLADLAYARVIRVPGLDAVIAPRLYVRTLQGKGAVYYASDPRMLAEFARLQRELAAWRRGG
jgi:hypothetical protein